MVFRKMAWYSLGVAVLAVALAGCPGTTPLLNVSPPAFSFDNTIRTSTMTLSNGGGGSLTWEIESLPDWLTATPMSGTITGASQVVQLEADPTGVPTGTQQGQISIVSNGGNRGIAATLTVAAGPTLELSPTVLDFGSSQTTSTFQIRNVGAGTLEWAVLEPLPNSFSVNTLSGSTAAGASQTLTVTFNRAGLTPGTYGGPISVASNGGSGIVAVTALVQALRVAPTSLEFGSQIDQLAFILGNGGTTDLHWNIDSIVLPDWAQLTPLVFSGTLSPGAETEILVDVDRTGLPASVTYGQIRIGSDAGSEIVQLSVQGFDPILFVNPDELDFGTSVTQKSLTLANNGTGMLSWTIEEVAGAPGAWVPQDYPWLSVIGGTTGQIDAAQSTTLSVEIDRTQAQPNPNQAHIAYLRVTSLDGDEAIVAVRQFTLPPTLKVIPSSLVFGTTYTKRKLAIWNGGLGVVNWRIDPVGQPDWIDLDGLPIGASITGSVSGEETDMVNVNVDRSGLEPQDEDYRWTFDVTAQDGTGNDLAAITVTVTLNVARFPVITVDTGENSDGVPNVDLEGVAFLPFGTALNSSTFSISNQGTADLEWKIDTTALPTWLKSVQPSQGTLRPLESVTITVNVDRTGQASGDKRYNLNIASNDPVNSTLPVRIEMQVPKRIVIGVKPAEIALGTYGISDSFEVANLGDARSILNFQITSTKQWLYFYPETGSSEGTDSLIKDWKSVNISVDRAQLDGSGGSATLIISAFETDENGQRITLDYVEPVEVTVTVEAAPLTFEAAKGRTRIPSLLRFVFLLRDIAYEPIALAWDTLDDYVNSFAIFEKDVPVETAESGQFLTSGEHLKTRLALLLDYSGSMYAAASRVSDPEIAGAPDPLQALYEKTVSELIDELPPTYSLAIMEFHERSQPTRLITTPDLGPAFTRDKQVLKDRLASINVQDHGATELLPAVLDAALRIDDEDMRLFRIPFDDMDFRGIICVSDGRLTTPPGRTRDAADFMAALKVRFCGIGWGSGVLHEPLARLAAGTGGHYYPTRTETSDEIGPDGKPIPIPIVADLMDWCTTDDPAVAPCDQSLAKDFKSQVAFSYVTLTEDTPIIIRIASTFDNPNDDDNLCLADQGLISGSITQKDFDLLGVVGDVRLGQISMRSEGLVGGNARVVLRAEYIPRNVDTLEFEFTASSAFSVSLVPPIEGGIIADWTLTNTGPGLYRLTRPDTVEPLKYGAFGDLLYVDFDTVVGPSVALDLLVRDPVYTGSSPDEKYFVCPDRITVEDEEILAPAFPTPQIRVVSPATDEYWADFGSSGTAATIEVRNVGGNHVPTGVWLNWFATDTPSYLTITPTPSEGILDSSTDVATLNLTLDRSIDQGEYTGTFLLTFIAGTLGVESVSVEVLLTAVIEPPELSVSSDDFVPGTTTMNFGENLKTRQFQVANTGQSTLDWAVDSTLFPSWLVVAPTSGSLPLGRAANVNVTVDRATLAPGAYTHTFELTSIGGNELITVEMVVPVP